MIDKLPPEIILLLLKSPILGIHDIVNLSSTCRYLRTSIQSNNLLWKDVYFKVFSTFPNKSIINDYLSEIRKAYEIRHGIQQILSDLAIKYSYKDQLIESDFEPYNQLLQSRDPNFEYAIHYLKELIEDNSPINSDDCVTLMTPGNLTLKYYSLASLRYLRQIQLASEFKRFFDLDPEDQIMEIPATMIEQWLKPNSKITIDSVGRKLDYISGEVKRYLKIQNPKHPLFEINEEQLKVWREKDFYKNQFSTKHSRQILDAMKDVVCELMDFNGEVEDYYNVNNSFMTVVLASKRGLPITLAVIYQAIARRLGVNLAPINTPVHFLLRFTDEEVVPKTNFYVDVFNGGSIYGENEFHFHRVPVSTYLRTNTRVVITRMCDNIENALKDSQPNSALPTLRSILELIQLINPDQPHRLMDLCEFYINYRIDSTKLQEKVLSYNFPLSTQRESILQLLSYSITKIKKTVPRSPNVEFAVGMIMDHKVLGYTCVIYGWDNICEQSNEWQRQMNVAALKYGANQPFYHVLADDETKRYAAQENLVVSTNYNRLSFEKQNEIGRFFTHFYKNHYVPESFKQSEYPDDVEVRRSNSNSNSIE